MTGTRQRGGWKLERRTVPEHLLWYRLGAIVLGIGLALAGGPLLSDDSVSTFYSQIWTDTFGGSFGLRNIALISTPLILVALAACVPYRLRLWNIGGDGQMYIGAWLAAALAFAAPSLHGGILVPLMLVAGAVGGALWALGPALARAYLGVNEIITTLLLNFIGLFWLLYWATGPWKDPDIPAGITSKGIPSQSELGLLRVGDVEVHWGFALAVALAVVGWALLRRSRLGYELSILNASERAGAYAGMPARRRIVQVLLVGGAFGGVAGAVEMMGNVHRYTDSLSNQTGYAGVVVAVLAAGSLLGAVPLGIVFAGLIVGGNALRASGISSDLVFAVIGFVLLVAAAGDGIARYRVVRIREPRAESPAVPAAVPGEQGGGS